MPQIPSPIPEIAPTSQGAPGINLDTPAAAFGVATAQAQQELGHRVAQAGDELFARALALQQLRNDTEAREADVNYMIGAGELHAKFNSLQGQDAVKAYPKYAQDLKDLRSKLRGGLSNDAVRKLFDAQSMNTMGRSIFNGAGHAASENRQWAVNTGKAQMELDAKTVEDNPQDESLFTAKLQRVRENAAALAGLEGAEPGSPIERNFVAKATSRVWAQRIIGLSRTAPFEAAKMLDKNSKAMTEDDRLKVDNIVRSSARAVGSVNIANEIYAGGMETPTRSGKTLKEMEDEAEAKAKALSPDDPILAQHAITALRGKFNQDKYAQRQEQLINEQVVSEAIRGGVRNEQELRANPKIAAAIDALPPSKRLAIPGMINRYNAASQKDENENNFYRLKGLANNDVESFLNTDITKEKISRGQMDQLMVLQQKIKDKQNSDPRVARAVTILRGAMGAQLEAAGVYRRTDANKGDYDNFTGTLQSAIDVWIETHGKPPTAKDITETIGPQVIQQRTEPAFFNIAGFGITKQTPFFTQTVPEEFTTKITADVLARGGAKPTTEQIYRAYVRSQYIKLYGKKEPTE